MCKGGPMLLLLKSYCFAELVRRNAFGRADARTRYLDAKLAIHEASLDARDPSLADASAATRCSVLGGSHPAGAFRVAPPGVCDAIVHREAEGSLPVFGVPIE